MSTSACEPACAVEPPAGPPVRPVVTLSCSLIVTSCHLLGALSRVSLLTCAQRRLLLCVLGGEAPRSCGIPRFSSRESDPDGLKFWEGLCVQANGYKSVIRTCTIFAPQMVTGEFYARVTTHCITRTSRALPESRYKRPVGRWLRSSSNNDADQSGIVTESLCKFSRARRSAVDITEKSTEVPLVSSRARGSAGNRLLANLLIGNVSPTARSAASTRG